MSETAAAQLRRVLLAIPRLADGEEHEIAELAKHVGVSRETLIDDLRSLVTRFDEPGGFVEGVQLFIDGDRVSLNTKTFLRPMRLTASELGALDLGLAMLRAERPPDERPVIDRARERLARVMVDTPADAIAAGQRAADLAASGDPGVVRALRAALEERRKVQIRYRKASVAESEARIVRPYSLLMASGAWYVIGYCDAIEDVRIFRVDRIEGVDPRGETYEIPATFSVDEVLSGRKVLRPGAPRTLRVRYSARVARWIAEREGGELAADGTLTLGHPLADVQWGVRHVLQYGPDAEVLEPVEVRKEVVRRLQVLQASVRERRG